MKVYIGENEIKTLGHYITSGDIKDATLEPEEALNSKTFYNNSGKQIGTMANQGAINATLNAGENYIIPKGYHNGSGKVSANSLASQTQATAIAADILSDKTAWVNGELLTGSLEKGMKIKTGTLYPDYYGFTVSDLDFTPKGIMACLNDNYNSDIEYRTLFIYGIEGESAQGFYPVSRLQSYYINSTSLNITFSTNSVSVSGS